MNLTKTRMSFEKHDFNVKSQLMDRDCNVPLHSDPTTNIKAEIDDFTDTPSKRGWKEWRKIHCAQSIFWGVLPKVHKTIDSQSLSINFMYRQPYWTIVPVFRLSWENVSTVCPYTWYDRADVLNQPVFAIKDWKYQHISTVFWSLFMSLHTWIPHNPGVQALSHSLHKCPEAV